MLVYLYMTSSHYWNFLLLPLSGCLSIINHLCLYLFTYLHTFLSLYEASYYYSCLNVSLYLTIYFSIFLLVSPSMNISVLARTGNVLKYSRVMDAGSLHSALRKLDAPEILPRHKCVCVAFHHATFSSGGAAAIYGPFCFWLWLASVTHPPSLHAPTRLPLTHLPLILNPPTLNSPGLSSPILPYPNLT